MPIFEITDYYIRLGLNITVFVTVFSLIMGVLSFFVASYCVYVSTLSRNKEGKWGRAPSNDEPDYIKMDEIGMEWHNKHIGFMKPVHILNDGLNLYGEYYDFYFNQCVIILPGRSESLRYSYYFAQPYVELGYNVLVIDPRSHGESDGVYNTVGFGESGDVIAWAQFMHERHGMQHIILHGICIGAASGMLAITAKNCPDYVEGLVVEGMYANFREIMKSHLIERKKPTLILPMINMWMRRYTSYTMDYGPIDVIGKLNKPILMMHSKEDIYSLPKFAEMMYNKCPSNNKQIIWFETGEHSMLRITDTEKYDRAIRLFVSENFGQERYCLENYDAGNLELPDYEPEVVHLSDIG